MRGSVSVSKPKREGERTTEEEGESIGVLGAKLKNSHHKSHQSVDRGTRNKSISISSADQNIIIEASVYYLLSFSNNYVHVSIVIKYMIWNLIG